MSRYEIPTGGMDPMPIWERLTRECEEHAEIGEATVGFLLDDEEIIQGGKQTLGTVYLPRVQGKLNPLFQWMLDREFKGIPDFLVILDRRYWEQADARLREILVYHEMCHCMQAVDKYGEPRFDEDGSPVWALRAHDVEEFIDVVRRYGAWNPMIKTFLAAAGGDGRPT